jgi:hypothetical protein
VTPRALLHNVEVDLATGVGVDTLKVGRELVAQLSLRGEGPLM